MLNSTLPVVKNSFAAISQVSIKHAAHNFPFRLSETLDMLKRFVQSCSSEPVSTWQLGLGKLGFVVVIHTLFPQFFDDACEVCRKMDETKAK